MVVTDKLLKGGAGFAIIIVFGYCEAKFTIFIIVGLFDL